MISRYLLFKRSVRTIPDCIKLIKCLISSKQFEKEEKHLETPIIVMREQDQVEVIGPPDSLSNLRPILRQRIFNETALQTKLREVQNDTQIWNQYFWTNHNKKFVKEKQEFINTLLKEDKDKQITADEMSSFYKKFLDENWKTHVTYNKEWYIRNMSILFCSVGVSIEKTLGHLARKCAY